MMWFIASLPFWAAGGVLGMLGVGSIIYCLTPGCLNQTTDVQWVSGMKKSLWSLCASGVLLLIAAKVAS
jgi:hypothetical protein